MTSLTRTHKQLSQWQQKGTLLLVSLAVALPSVPTLLMPSTFGTGFVSSQSVTAVSGGLFAPSGAVVTSGNAAASFESVSTSGGSSTTIDTRVETQVSGVTKTQTQHLVVPAGQQGSVSAATSTADVHAIEFGSGGRNGDRTVPGDGPTSTRGSRYFDASLGPPPATFTPVAARSTGFLNGFFRHMTQWFWLW